MAEIDHEKIRILAYELWERDGAPEGKSDDYWHAAVQLLSEEGDIEEPSDPASVLIAPILPRV